MNAHFAGLRADMLFEIRSFFRDRDYIEVDTPHLSPSILPEPTIDVFSTRIYRTEDAENTGDELYLLPSPERWMKRLVERGYERIFQIGHVFRNREETGRLHSPEFTMLEWYTTGAGYVDSLDVTDELLVQLDKRFVLPSSLSHPIERRRLADEIARHTGIREEEWYSLSAFKHGASRAGISISESADWEEAFHTVFLSEVESELPSELPTALIDYPAGIRCLARIKSNTPFRERWELYAGGVELANCYTEETDPDAIASYIEQEKKSFVRKKRTECIDTDIASEYSSPARHCSGVALGVDRLIMLAAGAERVRDVLYPFDEE